MAGGWHIYSLQREVAHSVDGNLSALTHKALCRSETPVSSCRGNAAWIHMITFLINFPAPIATICPLMHIAFLKEKILSFMNRKLFSSRFFNTL